MAGMVLFSLLGYMACVRLYDWWHGYAELF